MNVRFEATNHVLTVPVSQILLRTASNNPHLQSSEVLVPTKGGHNVHEWVSGDLDTELVVGKFLRFERKYQ